MPPKSSTKKSTISWYSCEKCKVNITSKEREGHENLCPITENSRCSYIRDEVLYTTAVDIKEQSEETNDIPLKQLNKLIFISESVLRLCRFVIGEHIAISSTEKSNVAPLIRLAWPIPDRFLTTVLVSKQDFVQNWHPFNGVQLKLEKLPIDPIEVNAVTLKFSPNYTLDKNSIPEFSKVLKSQLRNLSFFIGNEIVTNFYNQELKLIITNFQNWGQNTSLEEAFNQLSIKRDIEQISFIITTSTRIEILGGEDEDDEPNNVERYKVKLSDIGGLNHVIKEIKDSFDIALGFLKTIQAVKVSRGMLVYGPSGCGKSMICEAFSNELTSKVDVLKLNASEIFSKFFGETEKNLNKYFDKAFDNYPRPSLIIIEDINNICPRHDTNEIVKRVSIAFLGILDSLHLKPKAKYTFVLATSTDIENVNPALRRCGRFDVEVEIGVPSPKARHEIIQKYLEKIDHILTEEEIQETANVTHGFVGADLINLISKAALNVLKNSGRQIQGTDINFALSQVKPSAMREVAIENPNVKWEDIGGQEELKLKLKQAIEWPLLYPEKFVEFGIKPPRGVLMFGPPGCSKTMIAKALATESKVNFLSIKGPELFSMWVGESERAVREVFRKARQVAPSIIFFDEIDAIGGERSSDSGSSVKERVLAQLLTELDGVNSLNNVTIVAATNRPDMIDKALMRPGRLDRIVHVGLPDENTRRDIFKIKLRKMPISSDVDVEQLVKQTEGYSGAEIQAICHEAAFKTLEENLESTEVCWQHFEYSLKIVQPRTSSSLLKLYENYLKKN